MKKTKKVLIVDDEEPVREAIKMVFKYDKEYDFETYEAATEEKAKAILENSARRFDVVIIDLSLKGGAENVEGGFEVLKILNRLKIYMPKIKVVFSGFLTYELVVRAMKAGADNVINKKQPGSIDKLLEAVKEELRARRSDENEPDDEYLQKHFDEWAENFHGELLAFIDGKLVYHSKSKKELLQKVKEKHPDEEPYIMYAPVRMY